MKKIALFLTILLLGCTHQPIEIKKEISKNRNPFVMRCDYEKHIKEPGYEIVFKKWEESSSGAVKVKTPYCEENLRNIDNKYVKNYKHFLYKPSITKSLIELKKLNEFSKISIDYDVKPKESNGQLYLDVWLTKHGQIQALKTLPITHEIHIWLNPEISLDDSKAINSVKIDGVSYILAWGRVCNGAGNCWKLVTVASEMKLLGKQKIDFSKLIGYLKDNNFIQGHEYLASVELGVESMGNQSEAVVNNFSMSLE